MRALSLLLLAGCHPTTRSEALSSKYHEREEWAYHTRAGEERSTLVVGKVEKDEKLAILVHVTLHNIKLHNSLAKSIQTSIDHMPFSEAAIDKSVTTLLGRRSVDADFS